MDESNFIVCPHCGKKSLTEDKCSWCNYRFKKREHPYPKDLYDFLDNEYRADKNKVRCIKLGMSKYGLPMKDIKEIVDYIADEVYEEERVKSLEEINPPVNDGSFDFRFSFVQYFIHFLIWKLLVLAILQIPLGIFVIKTMGLGVVLAIYVDGIAIAVILLQWATASTAVFHTAGKREYVYRTSVGRNSFRNDDPRAYRWNRYYVSTVKRIDYIKETPFSYIIYGKFEERIYDPHHKRQVSTYDKLKLKKMFKRQSELMERLEPKRERK